VVNEAVTRHSLPADTVELLELLADRLNIATGRQWLKLEFKDGRFDNGRIERYVTRSTLVAHDAERASE
jgi:hypothetical protein